MGIPSKPAGSGKNSTALRDLVTLLLFFAVLELTATLVKKSLVKKHPKRKGVPLAVPLRPE
jgi:hypothetical protein